MPEFDTGLPVLLFRTNHYPLHHGTLAAVRSLGRAGIEVHALLEGRASPVRRSRYLWCSHEFGPRPTDASGLLGHLALVADRIGRAPLLIPLDDAAALFSAEHRTVLASRFRLPGMSRAPAEVADKSALLECCRRAGIPVPPSHVPTGSHVSEADLEALGFPMIGKWARPWMLPRGSRSTVMVRGLREARALFNLSSARDHRGAGPVIFQQVVGDTRHDWFFQGYFDDESNLVFGGVGRKRLAHPRRTGATVVGEWLPNPRLEDHVRSLAKRLGYTGPADLDFRYDQRNDTYSLLDYNPRLGAQFRLFTGGDGTDLVRVMHLLASGRPVPPVRPVFGRKILVENHFLPLMATNRPHGFAALRGSELAWLAVDDLAPMTTLFRQSVRVIARKTVRRAPSAKHLGRHRARPSSGEKASSESSAKPDKGRRHQGTPSQ
ncbi:ATP-grasp domain-containing protein [Spirillospora sp. NPDC052269]